MISLDRIAPGERVQVVDIPTDDPLKVPLEQFGITVGSILQCRYFSPGGDLAALESQGSVLALRRRELSGITGRYC